MRLSVSVAAGLWLVIAMASCVSDNGARSASNDVMVSGDSNGGGYGDVPYTKKDSGGGYGDVSYTKKDSGGGYGDMSMSYDYAPAPYDACASSDPGAYEGDTGGGQEQRPGQITAAEVDDNLNFGLFQKYLSIALQNFPGIATLPVYDRVLISVRGSNEVPVAGAGLVITADGKTVLRTFTRTNGLALFFPSRDGASEQDKLGLKIMAPDKDETLWEGPMKIEDGRMDIKLGSPGVLPKGLDLAFVVDATGSMGDELEYLKAEIADIVEGIDRIDGQQVSIRYALVVYRDRGDQYVTRVFDFTSNLNDFSHNLAKQSASGGGDYEEAVQEAMKKMTGLSWRTGNIARVVFHLADAPPHTQDSMALLKEVEKARHMGIGIYSVAASGVADTAEYLMRLASQDTLARYIWITDDSGIGGGHAEPHIAKNCMQVQYLNSMIKRLLRSEVSGKYIPPKPEDVLKEAGDPVDGVCTFDDGTKFYLW